MMDRGDFSRQSFLGPDSEQILADARVIIIGLGGGGSHIAQQLGHVGVGHFRLIDPQEIEDSNLNRLIGGTKQDVDAKTPKVDIAKRLIHGIRPWAEVRTAKSEWQSADDLLKDTHVLRYRSPAVFYRRTERKQTRKDSAAIQQQMPICPGGVRAQFVTRNCGFY